MRRLTALVLLFFFGATSLIAVLGGLPALTAAPPNKTAAGLPSALSAAMARSLGSLPGLPALFPELSTALGLRLQHGVYLTDTMLIEELPPPSRAATQANTEMLRLFVQRLQTRSQAETGLVEPIYFMLTPTARAIRQEDISAYAYPVDQKQLISSIYYHSDFPAAPFLSPVRAYEALERAGEAYLYYRTDSALTSLGGYHLYRELAGAMRLEPRSIGRFNVTHVSHDYRGELSHRVYSRNIPGDLVSVYDFADADDTYRVTHYGPEGTRVYHSLFPEHVLELGRPTDVILGGVSPRIDIRGANVFDERLLILSDRTVYAYISFLTLHFRDITILSTDMAADLFDPALIRDINPLEYDRILISLSIDSFTQTQRPAEALSALLPLLDTEEG